MDEPAFRHAYLLVLLAIRHCSVWEVINILMLHKFMGETISVSEPLSIMVNIVGYRL
jgi:hypothetical protein